MAFWRFKTISPRTGIAAFEMSSGPPVDWSQLLNENFTFLQQAPEELRGVQLDQVAQSLAENGENAVQSLPASVRDTAGQPGTLLPQFRQVKIDLNMLVFSKLIPSWHYSCFECVSSCRQFELLCLCG